MSLERVLADDYVGDVTALSMDDLRAKRAECQGLEVGLSYRRRLCQGRLDIVAAEQRRRAEGAPEPSQDDLVRNLAATLADRARPPGNGRLPQLLAPDAEDIDTDELDAIARPGALARITEVSDEELTALVDALSTYESQVSRQRRSLHERIDALQAEITRRYRTGEASVESLLK
jgi:anti-sigma-K factor RsiG